MLALVLDTSSAAVSAGVVEIRRPAGAAAPVITVLAEQVTIDARAHGELLVPSIRRALAGAGRRLPEIDCLVAGVGPGPFTGLRIGLVTAAALSDALGRPAYGVCSLDAIAQAVAVKYPRSAAGRLLVAGDARRREVYWAQYQLAAIGNPAVEVLPRLSGPAVDLPAVVADLSRLLAAAGPSDGRLGAVAGPSNGHRGAAAGRPDGHLGPDWMCGAGARLYSAILELPLLDVDYPTVAGLAACAASRVLAAGPGEALTPLYLRRPDAVPATQVKPVGQ